MKKIILTTLAVVMMSLTAVSLKLVPAYAADCPDGQVKTSILGNNGCADVGDNGDGIFMILNLVLSILTYGVGILATIGIVISGYTYLTAKDDASKVQKSKDRILQIVIGLAIYAVMWTILQFLLPGGLFGDGS